MRNTSRSYLLFYLFWFLLFGTLIAFTAYAFFAWSKPKEAHAAPKTHVVAWSVWTGWMPFHLMKTKGFLKKRAKQYGVKVRLKQFKGYLASVQAFSAGSVDACAMTSMEALQPAAAGVDTVVTILNDISHGGDGILVRKGMKAKDLKGKRILLEQFSVSHYLLSRFLTKNNLTRRAVKIQNIPGDDAGKAFLTDKRIKAVATWNPHLFKAQEGKQGDVLFSSKDIPGEILDFLVFNGKILKRNPAVGKAVVHAWYDAMDFYKNPKTKTEAIRLMAKGAGSSVSEFKKMLGGTRLFVEPGKAKAFLESNTFKNTMVKVRKFSFKNKLLKGIKKEDELSMNLGKAGVVGKKQGAKLRVDLSFLPGLAKSP